MVSFAPCKLTMLRDKRALLAVLPCAIALDSTIFIISELSQPVLLLDQ